MGEEALSASLHHTATVNQPPRPFPRPSLRAALIADNRVHLDKSDSTANTVINACDSPAIPGFFVPNPFCLCCTALHSSDTFGVPPTGTAVWVRRRREALLLADTDALLARAALERRIYSTQHFALSAPQVVAAP